MKKPLDKYPKCRNPIRNNLPIVELTKESFDTSKWVGKYLIVVNQNYGNKK